MAEFVSVYYTVWFIRAPLVAAVQSNDIKAIWQLHHYRKYIEAYHPNLEHLHDAVDSAIDSPWHLDETLIPLTLFDPVVEPA